MKKLIIGLSLLMIVGCDISSPSLDKWVVVTDGECFTYKRGRYIDQTCYKTEAEATADLKSFIAFSNKRKSFEDRIWVDVNTNNDL